MDDLKTIARAAKSRLKSNFWAEQEKSFKENASEAKNRGISELKVKSSLADMVKSKIKGEKEDEFYLKVKKLLETEGEVSDAIGRLTDRSVYEKLTYEERQRYTLELSSKYLIALQRYKKEKALGLI